MSSDADSALSGAVVGATDATSPAISRRGCSLDTFAGLDSRELGALRFEGIQN